MKFRKGDWWKATLLIVAIVLVGAFIYRQLKETTSGPRPQARAGAPTTAAPATETPREMYTPRQRASAQDLSEARSSDDPFRPEVPQRSGARATAARPASAARNDAAGDYGLWLAGVVGSSETGMLAVIRYGNEPYFVRTGESVPGGWRVSSISNQSVLLRKGEQQRTLMLGDNPAGRGLPNW